SRRHRRVVAHSGVAELCRALADAALVKVQNRAPGDQGPAIRLARAFRLRAGRSRYRYQVRATKVERPSRRNDLHRGNTSVDQSEAEGTAGFAKSRRPARTKSNSLECEHCAMAAVVRGSRSAHKPQRIQLEFRSSIPFDTGGGAEFGYRARKRPPGGGCIGPRPARPGVSLSKAHPDTWASPVLSVVPRGTEHS